MDQGLIIYSIPKCGMHFVSQVVALLLNPECNIYDKDKLYGEVRHVQKKEFLTDSFLTTPYFNTHPNYLGYEKMTSYPHKKIFTVRNPLDKSISSFFYRIYNRADGQRRRRISNNLNAEIYDYCIRNIDRFSNQILVHIEQSYIIPDSYLFDYCAFIEDKPFYIEQIANIMELSCDQKKIDWIAGMTDIKKCADYEEQHDSFRVGAVQNGAFFRRGVNNDFQTYLDAGQIDTLKRKIPSSLKTFYKL